MKCQLRNCEAKGITTVILIDATTRKRKTVTVCAGHLEEIKQIAT